jgi:plastocyanin
MGRSMLIVAAALVAAPVASGQEHEHGAAIPVNADGNAFGLGAKPLQFDPRIVHAQIGQTVRWTNTDFLVPHTATEDHGLWDLGGSYGGTPLTPSGFGPGETAGRAFEAGTHFYYCRVHPVQMRGAILVPVNVTKTVKPVRVRVGKRKVPGRRVTFKVEWAASAPATGLAFDIERRTVGRGAWSVLQIGTTEQSLTFAVTLRRDVRRRYAFRARLRKADDANKATEWSPVVSIAA